MRETRSPIRASWQKRAQTPQDGVVERGEEGPLQQPAPHHGVQGLGFEAAVLGVRPPLELKVERDPGAEAVENLVEGRDALASTGVERLELAEGRFRDLSATAETRKPLVVGHHDRAIPAHVKVDLDHVGRLLHSKRVGGEGIFGSVGGGAAVSDHKGRTTGPSHACSQARARSTARCQPA